MQRDEGGRRGARLLAAAATLVSPLVAYMIFRSAAIGMSSASAAAAAGLPPEDPAPALAIAARLAQAPQQPITSEMVALARASLAVRPLGHHPFFIAARAAEQAGDRDRAIALMEEARRRRPTSTPVRMHLMAYYTHAGRHGEALTEIDLLLRRNRDLRRLLLPSMVQFAADPAGRAALARLLAQEPEWRQEFLAVAGGEGLDPADAAALVRDVQAAKPGGDVAAERELLFQSLAAAGRYGEARQQWLAALPPQERARSGLVFDATFAGAAAPRPFGWDFQDGAAGRAEIVRDGDGSYLDVAHFGTQDLPLAEQMLVLPPGRYTLRSLASAETPLAAERLTWRIVCVGGSGELTRLDLAAGGETGGAAAASFEVPAGCPAQRLVLHGSAGETASVAAAQVRRVEVVR